MSAEGYRADLLAMAAQLSELVIAEYRPRIERLMAAGRTAEAAELHRRMMINIGHATAPVVRALAALPLPPMILERSK